MIQDALCLKKKTHKNTDKPKQISSLKPSKDNSGPYLYFLLDSKSLLYLSHSPDFLDQVALQSPGSTMASPITNTHPKGEMSGQAYHTLSEQEQKEGGRRAIVWFLFNLTRLFLRVSYHCCCVPVFPISQPLLPSYSVCLS